MKFLKATILFSIMLFCSCNKDKTIKAVFQPDEVTGKDVVISEAYETRNYSHLERLHLLSISVQDTIDNDSRFLIRFGFASIPQTAKIDSAFIYLKAIEPGHFGEKNSFYIQRSKSVWINKDVNWENQPEGEESDQILINAPTDKMQPYKIDVTNYVKNVVNKTYPNYGYIFRLESEEKPYKGIRFCSSNHVDVDSRPKLEVFYKE